MTDDQTDPEDGWPTMTEAAALIGMSDLGFWRLARAERFEVRRRDNRSQVRRADVEAYLERSHPHPPAPTEAYLERSHPHPPAPTDGGSGADP